MKTNKFIKCLQIISFHFLVHFEFLGSKHKHMKVLDAKRKNYYLTIVFNLFLHIMPKFQIQS
jgi:hypothetical protein